MVLSVIV